MNYFSCCFKVNKKKVRIEAIQHVAHITTNAQRYGITVERLQELYNIKDIDKIEQYFQNGGNLSDDSVFTI